MPEGVDLYSRFFLAGGVCASFSHTGSVPLDVIKTKIQLEPSRFDGSSTLQVAKSLVQEEGPGCLLLGAGPTLFGYFLQGSLKYGLYETFKVFVAPPVLGEDAPRLAVLLLSAVLAESIASTALTPLEAVRIKMVKDPEFADNTVAGLARLVREGGGVFNGQAAILAKMVPYTAFQLSTFETATSALYSAFPEVPSSPALRLPASFACAALAAVVSSIASQPGDSVLSEVNNSKRKGQPDDEERGRAPSRGLVEVAAELGVAGLFRGTQARIAQMLVIVVTQLLVYDAIKALCGIPVTGASH